MKINWIFAYCLATKADVPQSSLKFNSNLTGSLTTWQGFYAEVECVKLFYTHLPHSEAMLSESLRYGTAGM